MTGPADKAGLSDPHPNALLLGNMALAAGLIREAATKAVSADDAEPIVKHLGQIGDYSNTISDTASDMADALGCGPQAVEAAKVGMARIEAFRACQGLEGSA